MQFWVSTSRNLLEPVPHLPKIFLFLKFSLPFVTSLPLAHRVKRALCSLLPQTESAGTITHVSDSGPHFSALSFPCLLHPHHLSVHQQGLLLHVCGSGNQAQEVLWGTPPVFEECSPQVALAPTNGT